MKQHQIEVWVLDIIDKLKEGQPVEDSRVELKSNWIPPEKAARRIAGHANAARGAQILWVIGVDENQRRVTGANHEEFSDWFQKVKSQFDGFEPMLDQHINIPVNDKTVVALLFDTQRAPYVIKIPEYGKTSGVSASLEVPWRDGTTIRSARRAELLLILSPIVAFPRFEVLGGFLNATIPQEPDTELWWTLRLDLYVEPTSMESLSIPFHRCEVRCDLPEIGWCAFREFKLSPPFIMGKVLSKTIEGTPDEVIVRGAGRIGLSSVVETPLIHDSITKDVRFNITLVPSNTDSTATIDGILRYYIPDDKEFGRWVYRPPENDISS